MKNYNRCILFLILLLLAGCQNFLNVKPRNIKVVQSVEDYRDILASYVQFIKKPNPAYEKVLGEFYLPEFDMSNMCAFYTGESKYDMTNETYFDSKRGELTEIAVQAYSWLRPRNFIWEKNYTFLGPINLIINGVSEEIEGDPETRNYVKGEALVWRAYAYYKLLQFYAPMDGDEYGIPIYLKPYENVGTAQPERETQTTVYRRIITDCEEALALLEKTPKKSWNLAYDKNFIHSLLADVYSFKALSAAREDGDWEKVEKYTSSVLETKSFNGRDVEAFKAIFDCSPETGLQTLSSREFTLRIIDGSNSQMIDFKNAYTQGEELRSVADGIADATWYARYKDDDIRKEAWFKEADGVILNNKYNLWGTNGKPISGGCIMPFRTADMYLLKAEALYRLGRESEAKVVLNDFKAGRYLDVEGSYTESDFWQELLKERKLEFYQENDVLWLDMKRMGITVERKINGQNHVLKSNDFRYCLPIPLEEIAVNENIEQTPGWENVIF